MSKQHTPTPWKRKKYNSSIYVIVKGERNVVYTPENSSNGEFDADFIVKACNNHERLIEALTNMVAWMQEFGDVPKSDIPFNEAKQLLTELKS